MDFGLMIVTVHVEEFPTAVWIHIVNGASNATASSDVLELETSGERTHILITDNCDSHKVSTTPNQAKPLGLVLMSLILILHVESCCRSYIHGLDYILAMVNIRNATIMSSQNMNMRKVLPSRMPWQPVGTEGTLRLCVLMTATIVDCCPGRREENSLPSCTSSTPATAG